MNLDLLQLREILEGCYGKALLDRLLPEDDEYPERMPFPEGGLSEEVDADALADLYRECLSTGAYLRALSLLKIVGEAWGPTPELLSLLSEALDLEDQELSTDPLPREFLGTQRARLAWSVIQKDTLAFAPCDGTKVNHGSAAWIVSRADDVGDQRLPDGLALVWLSTTRVAGALRPAGTRKQSRRRLELSCNVVFVGPIREKTGLSRVSAELQDLSDTGAGVQVRDRFGRMAGASLKGSRVRLELRKPDQKDPMVTLATIRWVDQETSETHGQVCRLGLKFEDPPQEFLSSVEELLSPGKGDVQYLWSLWESDSKKA